MIILYPRTILQKRDKIIYEVRALKDLGLKPNATVFIHALRVMLSTGESTRKKKIEVMKSLGWSEEEIFGTFKRCPQILQYSEKKIRITVDFFINSVDLGPEILLVYPSLFCLSVDKRVRPWYNVINVLKSKNLIKREKKFPSLLLMSEKKFLENYVDKYADDVPGLWEVYTGTANTKKKGT
jgi:mTERF domain-containing protein